MEVHVEIEGLQELREHFNYVSQSVKDALGETALAGADIIRDDARSRAPRDTGKLREGIISEVVWFKHTTKAFAGCGMDADMNDIFVKHNKAGKRFYYPASVEYGTSTAEAHPFLRPALDNNKAKVKRMIAEKIRAIIEGG